MSAPLCLPDAVRTVPDALAWWAERTPDAPALELIGAGIVSYAQLWQGVCRLRSQLHALGIGRGSRVALLVPDEFPLAVLLLAVVSTAAAMPLETSLATPERHRLLTRLDVDALLLPETGSGPDRFMTGIAPVITVRGTGAPRLDALRLDGDRRGRTPDRSAPSAGDVATLYHTSGTTGTPRLVPHTHATVMTWARASIRDYGLSSRDRTVGLGSLAQSAGEVPLRHALVAGSAYCCVPRSAHGALLDLLDSAAPTWLFLTAGMVRMLHQALAREPHRPLPSSLRFVRFTSAAIPGPTLARMERRFGLPIYPEYSSSEAGIIARVTPLLAGRKPRSVGLPFLDVRIVDGAGADVPSGCEGEIVVRGPTVMQEDAARDDRGRVFMPGGWLRTGDLGRLDRDGYLFVTGRATEIINRGGSKIVPADVDDALLSHPAVADAAVFGVSDARLGEDIVAAVKVKPGRSATPRELRAWLLDRLSPYKVPRHIWFVETLPRTASGKVRRGELARSWDEQR